MDPVGVSSSHLVQRKSLDQLIGLASLILGSFCTITFTIFLADSLAVSHATPRPYRDVNPNPPPTGSVR